MFDIQCSSCAADLAAALHGLSSYSTIHVLQLHALQLACLRRRAQPLTSQMNPDVWVSHRILDAATSGIPEKDQGAKCPASASLHASLLLEELGIARLSSIPSASTYSLTSEELHIAPSNR